MLNILKLILSPLRFILNLLKPAPESASMVKDAGKMSQIGKRAMLKAWLAKRDA